MKNILLILCPILFLASCGGTKKQNVITENTDSLTIHPIAIEDEQGGGGETLSTTVDERFAITIPHYLREDEEYKEGRVSTAEDTIARGSLAYSRNSEIGLFGKLKLNEKWLCIMLPNHYWQTKLRTDVLSTVGHLNNESPTEDYCVTTLSVKNQKKNENELGLDYDIAFRGDYQSSDFNYYNPIEISLNDSLRITNTIRTAIEQGKTRDHNLGGFTLFPSAMYRVKDDLFCATYQQSTEEYSENKTTFLVKNNKVIFVDSGVSDMRLDVFRLKKQDYIWTETSGEGGLATFTLYKLSGDKLTDVFRSQLDGC